MWKESVYEKNCLKIISILLCFILLFTSQISTVFAADNIANQFKVIENNDTICTAVAKYQGDELRVTLNKLTDEITMQSIEKSPLKKAIGVSPQKDIIHNYTVKVDQALSGEVSATVIDTQTKKSQKIYHNSNKVKAQAVIAVPLIDLLGSALLAFILAYVGYIVVQGVKYISASQIMTKIRNGSSDHYAAYTVPGKDVYIGGGITYNTAVTRMQLGFDGKGYNDVFSKSSSLAYAVAKGAGWGLDPTPLIGEIGKKSQGEQYFHFHVWGRTLPTHSFYPG